VAGCAIQDCKRETVEGSDLCREHTVLEKKGLLERGPSAVWEAARAAVGNFRVRGARQECRDWDCERQALPGTNYCARHKP
jgi:hypothetical protein